jgi:predicted DNA-binding transcriptional regulator AlpA
MSEHRLLTFPELRARKGIAFSRQHINDLVRRGIFPKSVKTPGGHVNFWLEAEVDQYIDRMIEARKTTPPDQAMAGRVAKMLAARAAKRAHKAAGTVTITRRRKSRQPTEVSTNK